MSKASLALVLIVVAATVFLTLRYTSSTPTMQEIVISAEPTGPPVAVPSPSQSSTSHAVIPDGSVVSR